MAVKVVMAAPFDSQGRYQGGIHTVVNNVIDSGEMLKEHDLKIIPFNTCRIQRKSDSTGSLSVENLKNFFLEYRDVVGEVKAASPDVFYMHSSIGMALLKDLLILRHVKRATRYKTVLHVHYADYDKIMPSNGVLARLILRLMKEYVDMVVFLSRKTMEEFIAHGLDAQKCTVIYNFSTMSYPETQLQERMREPNQVLQLLFVGSVDKRKGIFDVLECLTKLKQKVKLHVCGGFGSEQDRVRFETYQTQLGDTVEFHGYINGDEKKAVFLQADVLLLPSYGEGLPMVILEAFSATNAVITTNVGAIPEIVDQECGFVVDPGDQDAICKAIAFYAEGDGAALLRHQAHNLAVAEQYSLRMFIQKISEVCRFTKPSKD